MPHAVVGLDEEDVLNQEPLLAFAVRARERDDPGRQAGGVETPTPAPSSDVAPWTNKHNVFTRQRSQHRDALSLGPRPRPTPPTNHTASDGEVVWFVVAVDRA